MSKGKEKITISVSKHNLERMKRLGISNYSQFIDNMLTDYLDYIEERMSEMHEDEREKFKKMLSYPYLALLTLLE